MSGEPRWLRPLVEAVEQADPADIPRRPTQPPAGGGTPAAVLVLIGETPAGPDVLLIERASVVGDPHSGQAAFPGGREDPEDEGSPAATALREAAEEVGVEPSGVEVVSTLPPMWTRTGYAVIPVVGWWRERCEVGVVDANEVARVVQIPIAELVDPANRFRVRNGSGHLSIAFDADGLLVWGFTAAVLAGVLDFGGWTRPWDETVVRDLPAAWAGRPIPAAAPAVAPLVTPPAGDAPPPPVPGTVDPGRERFGGGS